MKFKSLWGKIIKKKSVPEDAAQEEHEEIQDEGPPKTTSIEETVKKEEILEEEIIPEKEETKERAEFDGDMDIVYEEVSSDQNDLLDNFEMAQPQEVEQQKIEQHRVLEEEEVPETIDPVEQDAAKGEIEIYVNNEKTNVYKLTKEIRIGRDPSQAEIAIPELIVSKLHCTIFFQDDDVYIKDNSSTNGTYVNNQKISEQRLVDKDSISLGKKGTVQILFSKE
jgi:hypothetical protein